MKTRTLTRWHSRIGILVCVWILLLASTGLLLQHSHRLGLDKPLLTAPVWYALADLPEPKVTGVEAVSLYQVDNRLLSRHGSLAVIDGDLQGLLAGSDSLLVSDLGQLWLLTLEGELVDSMPLKDLVLAGISAGGLPLLKDGQGRHWQLDWWLEQAPVPAADDVVTPPTPFETTTLPDGVVDGHSGVSVERLLHALHSGRIFGALGEWLMTAVALMAIGIACTGFVIWGRRR